MIKHWDMLFLPNYARSWVVLVCVCVCHVSTPADAQICDDEIVWSLTPQNMQLMQAKSTRCPLNHSQLLFLRYVLNKIFVASPSSYVLYVLNIAPAGSLGTRRGASIRPGNLGVRPKMEENSDWKQQQQVPKKFGRVSGCLAIYTWYTWFTFIEKIQGSPRNNRYKAPRFWYPHTTSIVKNEVKTSYNRVSMKGTIYVH